MGSCIPDMASVLTCLHLAKVGYIIRNQVHTLVVKVTDHFLNTFIDRIVEFHLIFVVKFWSHVKINYGICKCFNKNLCRIYVHARKIQIKCMNLLIKPIRQLWIIVHYLHISDWCSQLFPYSWLSAAVDSGLLQVICIEILTPGLYLVQMGKLF